jgi:TatD DNase family protein
MMVKKDFDRPLTPTELALAPTLVHQALRNEVTIIINVGTSLIESLNCLELAKQSSEVYASVGIHPNDLTDDWKKDLHKLKELLTRKHELKIVGIGECGIDKHYPEYNLERQIAAFKQQIEYALEYDLALIVHTRDAPEETLACLEEYKNQGLKGTIHCFSQDLFFAHQALSWGFVLGIGGTITYPKNEILRTVVKTVGLEHIILETDAPFLPPQSIRGQENHPREIKTVALYLSELLGIGFSDVSAYTTQNAQRLFSLRD